MNRAPPLRSGAPDWPVAADAQAKGSDIGDVVLLVVLALAGLMVLAVAFWLLPLVLDHVMLIPGRE